MILLILFFALIFAPELLLLYYLICIFLETIKKR